MWNVGFGRHLWDIRAVTLMDARNSRVSIRPSTFGTAVTNSASLFQRHRLRLHHLLRQVLHHVALPTYLQHRPRTSQLYHGRHSVSIPLLQHHDRSRYRLYRLMCWSLATREPILPKLCQACHGPECGGQCTH